MHSRRDTGAKQTEEEIFFHLASYNSFLQRPSLWLSTFYLFTFFHLASLSGFLGLDAGHDGNARRLSLAVEILYQHICFSLLVDVGSVSDHLLASPRRLLLRQPPLTPTSQRRLQYILRLRMRTWAPKKKQLSILFRSLPPPSRRDEQKWKECSSLRETTWSVRREVSLVRINSCDTQRKHPETLVKTAATADEDIDDDEDRFGWWQWSATAGTDTACAQKFVPFIFPLACQLRASPQTCSMTWRQFFKARRLHLNSWLRRCNVIVSIYRRSRILRKIISVILSPVAPIGDHIISPVRGLSD